MAEDQGEPGAEAGSKQTIAEQPLTLSKDEPEKPKSEATDEEMGNEEEVKAEKVQDEGEEDAVAEAEAELQAEDKKSEEELKIETVKETHEDEDLEGSQSINLVLEDTEENEESQAGDKVEETNSEDKVEEIKEKDTDDPVTELAEVAEVAEVSEVSEMLENKVDAGSSKIDNNQKEADESDTIDETEKLEKELPSEQVTAKEVEGKPEESTTVELTKETTSSEEKIPSTVGMEISKDEEISKDKVECPVEDKQDVIESEVGIVGPPTAASELLSEEELVTEKPTLPTDETKVALADRVVHWVENTTTKADDPVDDAPLDDEEPDENKEADERDEEAEVEEEELEGCKRRRRGRKRKQSNGTNGAAGPATRKSQKVVSNIIRRSIRCLNKMHAMESGGGGNGKKAGDSAPESKRPLGAEDDESRKSPKVPQSQQNGAALPEETASADRNLLRCSTASPAPAKREKKEPLAELEAAAQMQSITSKSSKLQSEQSHASTTTTTTTTTTALKPGRPSSQRSAAVKLQQQLQMQQQQQQDEERKETPSRETRKRRSVEASASAAAAAGLAPNGNATPKKLCLDQREQFINSLMGSDKFTADQLAARAEQLRAEVQDLDELARAKEMEWNEILSMRKLKEEAYLRIERRRQIMGFMESNGPLASDGLLPPASLALAQQNYDGGGAVIANAHIKEKTLVVPKEERAGSISRESSPAIKRERASKAQSNYQQSSKQQQQQLLGENGPKQVVDAQSPEHRQIGEGRQGPIVDVRSIIADYRLRHPETVPRRRGRRMRNSVNVGLGAGGAVVENVGNIDSRPSSTDSCKSNSNVNDPNNGVSFKDVLVQFAKLSQQQGEPIKTPQNYPDVTLHPVAAAPTSQNTAPQTSGSLLHGILTKSQSPRPTTFSPTLARLLTAPERERSAPTITANPHQTTTQHLLQAYQGANPVSISDFLSSSKARTEITITPVVNNPIQTHSNNLIHVDDVEEETSIIEERDSRLSMGTRDNRDDRDTPPRCQGCHERAAQFVCAGCGNQWYCSRECQVAAWDEHSEVCSG